MSSESTQPELFAPPPEGWTLQHHNGVMTYAHPSGATVIADVLHPSAPVPKAPPTPGTEANEPKKVSKKVSAPSPPPATPVHTIAPLDEELDADGNPDPE